MANGARMLVMTVHIQQAEVEHLFRKIAKQRILLDHADFILQERLED